MDDWLVLQERLRLLREVESLGRRVREGLRMVDDPVGGAVARQALSALAGVMRDAEASSSRWASEDSLAARWYAENLSQRGVESVLSDEDLFRSISTNWIECTGESLTQAPVLPARLYDRFVAYEAALLVDLGQPAGRAWELVRFAFPASIGRASVRPSAVDDARDLLRAQPWAFSMLSPVVATGAWLHVRIQRLLMEDLNDPEVRKRVVRLLRSARLWAVLSVMESANGCVPPVGTSLSMVLASLRLIAEEVDPFDVEGSAAMTILAGAVALTEAGMIG